MVVLGLSAYAHEASACIVRNGIALALVEEEERVNREKHTWRFPEGAIREVFSVSDVHPSEVSAITFFWNPWTELTGNAAHFLKHFPRSLSLLAGGSGSDDLGFPSRILSMLRVKERVLNCIEGIDSAIDFRFVDHHLSHAASCFYVSPFDNSAILTVDGRGESSTALMAAGNGNTITELRRWAVPHSLGHL